MPITVRETCDWHIEYLSEQLYVYTKGVNIKLNTKVITPPYSPRNKQLTSFDVRAYVCRSILRKSVGKQTKSDFKVPFCVSYLVEMSTLY